MLARLTAVLWRTDGCEEAIESRCQCVIFCFSEGQFDGVNVGSSQDHVLIRPKRGLQGVDSDAVLLGVSRDEGAEDRAAKFIDVIAVRAKDELENMDGSTLQLFHLTSAGHTKKLTYLSGMSILAGHAWVDAWSQKRRDLCLSCMAMSPVSMSMALPPVLVVMSWSILVRPPRRIEF